MPRHFVCACFLLSRMQANAPDPLAAPRLTPDIVCTCKENLSNEISDCEQSLFSSKIREEERKTNQCASVTVGVTYERRFRELLGARASHVTFTVTLTCFAFSLRTALVDLSISFDLLADHEDLFYTTKVD